MDEIKEYWEYVLNDEGWNKKDIDEVLGMLPNVPIYNSYDDFLMDSYIDFVISIIPKELKDSKEEIKIESCLVDIINHQCPKASDSKQAEIMLKILDKLNKTMEQSL